MKKIAVTQRVDISEHGERRDCLDQKWSELLLTCGFLAMPVPNKIDVAVSLLRDDAVAGLLLTGGNDLCSLGGDASERDATEEALVVDARARGLPVLGVCRGMQILLHLAGGGLERIPGHVAAQQIIIVDNAPREVNSYHEFAAFEVPQEYSVWAKAEDGVIEAIRHREEKLVGMMWHPERLSPFAEEDIALVRSFYGAEGACV